MMLNWLVYTKYNEFIMNDTCRNEKVSKTTKNCFIILFVKIYKDFHFVEKSKKPIRINSLIKY